MTGRAGRKVFGCIGRIRHFCTVHVSTAGGGDLGRARHVGPVGVGRCDQQRHSRNRNRDQADQPGLEGWRCHSDALHPALGFPFRGITQDSITSLTSRVLFCSRPVEAAARHVDRLGAAFVQTRRFDLQRDEEKPEIRLQQRMCPFENLAGVGPVRHTHMPRKQHPHKNMACACTHAPTHASRARTARSGRAAS